MDSAYPAVSGALALETQLDILTNNVANMNTTGFKQSLPVYSGWSNNNQPGAGDAPVAFSTFDQIITDFSQGGMQTTGAPLDVAIEGDGMFAVQTPQGIRYTRNGHFTLDDQGQLLSSGGFPVVGTGGPITIPEGRITIDHDGRVSVLGVEPNTPPQELDTLSVLTVQDKKNLIPVGGSLYQVADGAEVIPAGGHFLQGMLEGSNVNPMKEMVAMIQVMRMYEAAQKSITAADEAATQASTQVGKVS